MYKHVEKLKLIHQVITRATKNLLFFCRQSYEICMKISERYIYYLYENICGIAFKINFRSRALYSNMWDILILINYLQSTCTFSKCIFLAPRLQTYEGFIRLLTPLPHHTNLFCRSSNKFFRFPRASAFGTKPLVRKIPFGFEKNEVIIKILFAFWMLISFFSYCAQPPKYPRWKIL